MIQEMLQRVGMRLYQRPKKIEQKKGKEFKHACKYLSKRKDRASNESTETETSSDSSAGECKYKYLYKYKQNAPNMLDDGTDDDTEEEREDLVFKYKFKYQFKYQTLVDQPLALPKKRHLPIPFPLPGLRKRNSAGPFLNREELEKVFPYEDYSQKYKRLKLIAEGAFGSVTMGERIGTKDIMAIKTTKLRKEPARIHNIAMEIYLMELCQHPNILVHKESFYWRKSVYSILEFCRGGSLTALRKIKITETQVRLIMRQLLIGLAHIHKFKVAHRDLKCANVMLSLECDTSTDNIKILSAIPKIGDFGLSCLVKDGQKELSMVGSRYWMSPEMIQRIGYNEKTDIYSLGCLMFELMTGSAPYRKKGGLYSLFYHATRGCPAFPPNIVSTALCTNFFSLLVEPNPEKRPTVASLLNHKWLTTNKETEDVLEAALNTAYKTIYANPKLLRRQK